MGLFDKLLGKNNATTSARYDEKRSEKQAVSSAPLLDDIIIDTLESIEYFYRLGESVSVIDGFKCESVSSIENAIKSMENQKWENIQLEKEGDMSVELLKNHKEEYGKWNDYVNAVKNTIIPKIEAKIALLPFSDEVKKTLGMNIKYDIVGIAMALIYRKYVRSEFYERMLIIYQSGHLPCGWHGKSDKGYFMVF